MARGIDDGVVPLVGEELLGGAGDGHTTLTLLLLPVHVEGESEGGLAKVGGLLLQLLELTLGDTCEEEEDVSHQMNVHRYLSCLGGKHCKKKLRSFREVVVNSGLSSSKSERSQHKTRVETS